MGADVMKPFMFSYIKSMQTPSLYHKAWDRIFPLKWVLGLVLIFLFGVPRFILVLNSYESGSSQWVSIVFTLMCFTPLVFLTKAGRKEMGVRKASSRLWLLWGFLLGCGMCLLLFAFNRLAFGTGLENPFVYIATLADTGNPSPVYFMVYMIIVMSFSPIGEELFYRGVVHQAFAEELGEKKASVIDSAAFALTHLAHFGLVFMAGGWTFLPLPAILWLLSTFLLCLVFNRVKRESGSILGAVLCHAGFNSGMGFLIFYSL